LLRRVPSVGVNVASEVLTEIRRLRQRVPAVTGTLVATLDGLLIAHDTTGVQPEGVAALSAAAIGLGQRVAATVRHGDVHEVVTRSSIGYVGIYSAGPRALLTVLADSSAHETRLGLDAREVAQRISAIIDVLDVFDFSDASTNASLDIPDEPPRDLPRRRA